MQARAQATRNRILDAAESLFEAHGYSTMTMSALARAAELSAGGLYEWFRNKDEVLTAVAERHLARVIAAIESSLAQQTPDNLESFARAVLKPALEAHAAHPALHRFLYSEAPRTASLKEALAGFEGVLEDAIFARLQAAGVPLDTARLRAALTTRAGEAALHSFVLDDSLPGSMTERLETLIEGLLRMALTAPRARKPT